MGKMSQKDQKDSIDNVIPHIINNQYTVYSKIAVAGFGTVYSGWDMKFDRAIAIKTLHKAYLDDAKYIDMFKQEAMSVAKLNHHNIVQVYDWIETGDDFFIIMEYIPGPNLWKFMRSSRKNGLSIPLNLGLHIIREACRGLEFAHSKNIIHKDITPGNILLSIEKKISITDFGIAKVEGSKILFIIAAVDFIIYFVSVAFAG